MRIRPAISADIPSMMAIERQAATAAHWSTEQYEAAFSGQEPSRVVLIIEEDAGAQGFIAGKVLGVEWEIENIAVAGPARRRGLGVRLLGEFLGLAQGRDAETVFLEVRESNRAARSFYEKWGFVERGRRKHYYREPDEDAIIYRLDFP
jgi:[ribosomal protein S18]-alanine N-acetyltransferase